LAGNGCNIHQYKEKKMRGKKARAIRKAVYDDAPSCAAGRKYYRIKNTGSICNHPASLRRKYQRAKNEALARQ